MKEIPISVEQQLEEVLNSGQSYSLYAANGQPILYDGWVELMVNLSGNNNPGLVIQVPFLVFLPTLTQPIIGSNVLD